MVGGVAAHLLIRPLGGGEEAARYLYRAGWRVQLWMVYVGSALLLVTGLLLWFGHFNLFTGWLLLGTLLYLAVAAMDGAFLSPNLRRQLRGDGEEASLTAVVTIRAISFLLLVVVIFLMTARPF
jgi:uncharacterized membrane protein